jgi:fructose-bisphosphate aldolase class I
VKREIVKIWGQDVLDGEGGIARDLLSRKVFGNEAELKKLNDERIQLIRDYKFNFDKMDDNIANNLAERALKIHKKKLDLLTKYYEQGARFAKWRAVIDVGTGIPTHTAIHTNAHALARYAALCQAAQIVPIVEPEVLMDGDHDINRCYDVTEWMLNETFNQLYIQRVALEGIVLKPNMAVPGKKSTKRVPVQEVAEKTIRMLKATVPSAVPGIAFLSGGQSDEEATSHLDAMNKIGGLPWRLTFSFGRALQAAPQKAWLGKVENVKAAQSAFSHRAYMNGLATEGRWSANLEKKAA